MNTSIVVSLIFIVLGLGLRYWINRMKFYRRSPTGAEGFSSYEKAVFIGFFERIGMLVAYALIIFGLMSLVVYFHEKNESKLELNETIRSK